MFAPGGAFRTRCCVAAEGPGRLSGVLSPPSFFLPSSSSSLAPLSIYNCPNFRPGKPGNVHSFDSRLSFSVCMGHLGTDSAVQI